MIASSSVCGTGLSLSLRRASANSLRDFFRRIRLPIVHGLLEDISCLHYKVRPERWTFKKRIHAGKRASHGDTSRVIFLPSVYHECEPRQPRIGGIVPSLEAASSLASRDDASPPSDRR